MRDNHPSTLIRSASVSALLLLAASLAGASQPPPDLHLEWLHEGRPTREAPDLEGRPGQTRSLAYVLRNVGGSPAFAVVISESTTLGRLGLARRVQPGPAPGDSMTRTLRFALAEGIREVCVHVTLQTTRVTDPEDPNPENNVLCRRVRVQPRGPDAGSGEKVQPRHRNHRSGSGGAEGLPEGRRNSP